MNNTILQLTRIVQQVALASSHAAQVTLIVDSISDVIQADVCSLYRINADQDMVLLASHGLHYKSEVMIPRGKGLVGLVAKSRHPVNVKDAAAHEHYFYLPQTQEEKFVSFCGVPLVLFGKVIGVLVVQSRQAELLDKESEGFLVALASQLALIVDDIPMEAKIEDQNDRYIGVKGAPGIGIGKVRLCLSGELNAVPDAECNDIAAAIETLHQLLSKVKDDIQNEQKALGSDMPDSVSAIFDAYRMLLADQALIEKVIQEIRLGHWLPYALKLAINHYSEIFHAMDDAYFRARAEDILHLGNKLYNSWRGAKGIDVNLVDGPVILVGVQVSVSDMAALPANKLAGIVCFEGSSLSHTSVLANAMGIPAVMGIGTLKGLTNGDRAIVDGNEGQIILYPSDVVAGEYKKLVQKERSLKKQLSLLKDLPAQTIDGHVFELFTNTGLLADISPGLKSGAEGVGLYRTEIPFMVRDSFPSEDEQVQVYERVLQAYANKPVYMRTLDIGGDKQLPYFPIHHEENPALGWRGIRFTLDNIQLLMTQVRAMIRAASGQDNLHVLLPMVISTSEVTTFLELLDDALAQLADEGVSVTRPKVGVMIEVPAAISQIPFWAKYIDFVSIGSNDLSQYLLALDRNNSQVADRYDHVHPAVLHELKRIVDLARTHKLNLSLCGEMAADPVAVVLLMGMGIYRLSMSAAKLPKIKYLIRSMSLGQSQQVLHQALTLESNDAIRALVNNHLEQIGFHEFMRNQQAAEY
ncbi:MAG: phosphoenolpyruvate-protein phosphotransferase [Oceanicoccus sp.]|jgi:phosphoenolpyruvate-protein phosphotransferase